jgi:septal ring-binding cell division protein DamX
MYTTHHKRLALGLCFSFLLNTLPGCVDVDDVSPEIPKPPEKSDAELLAKAKVAFSRKNYTESTAYLRPLAERQSQEGMYALGYMYYYGYGVEANPTVAEKWIRASADQGYEPALHALRQFVSQGSSLGANKNGSTYTSALAAAKPLATHNTETVSLETPSEISANSKTTAKAATQPSSTHKNGVYFSATPAAPGSNDISHPGSAAAMPVSEQALWVLKENPKNYTIQLTAKRTEPDLQAFIEKYQLGNQLGGQIKTFEYKYKNQIWHALSYGSYSDPKIAYDKLLGLPPELKAEKPWIRQFKTIEPVQTVETPVSVQSSASDPAH